MIDTVVLILNSDMFHIHDPSKFKPSAQWITQPTLWAMHGMRSTQNPTKKDLRAGIYKPRLTLSQRVNLRGVRDIILRIELSLPKLFFGNNFQELRYKDFNGLIRMLAHTLKEMGVIVDINILMHAPISAVHYSKNIPLTDGATPHYLISKIKEANVATSLDINQTDYRNSGYSYKWHCNAYEVVFYDKIKDLETARKSNKRALEKDSDLQLPLFESLKKKKKFEVFRMEVRLNKRSKMKQLFTKLGIKADLSFRKLYKPAISKKVLLHYLDEIESKRPSLLDYKAPDDKALLAKLRVNNPELSPKQIFQLFGFKKALESMSLRELQAMFSSCNKRSWYRLMADVRKVKAEKIDDVFVVLRKHIVRFKALTI